MNYAEMQILIKIQENHTIERYKLSLIHCYHVIVWYLYLPNCIIDHYADNRVVVP